MVKSQIISKTIWTLISSLFFLLCTFPLLAQTNYKLNKITFSGNHTIQQRTLSKLITEETRSKFEFWKKRDIFDSIILEQDVEILKTFYQTEGFLNVEIKSETTKNLKKETIDIEFVIVENEPIKINKINYNIISGTPQTNVQIPELNDILKSQNRFRDNDLIKAKEQFAEFLLNNGFPFQNISHDLSVNINDKTVDVTFNIDCGGVFTFGETTITGNKKTSAYYIKKEMAFEAGDTFDKRKLERTQQQVMDLGVFQFVTVKSRADENPTESIPMEIMVKEATRLNAKFGVGYGLEEQFRISADIQKLGFFRSINRFNVYLKCSKLEPYHIDLTLNQPLFFSLKNNLITNAYLKKQVAPAYTIKRYGAAIKIQRHLFKNANGFSGYSYEKNFLDVDKSILDEVDIQQITKYDKANILLGFTFDNSSPVFFPNQGFSLSAVTTLAGYGFKSDFHYYQVLMEAKKYYGITENLVIAGKVKLGMMEPTRGDKFTPLEERFYAGGSNSIRGWSYGQLSPKSDSNIPIGGNSLLENSVELRFPIWKIINGVIFTDFGNVWSESYHYNLRDLRYANGAGLRIKTPIGPIRLDGAISDENKFQFFLGIGQAF